MISECQSMLRAFEYFIMYSIAIQIYYYYYYLCKVNLFCYYQSTCAYVLVPVTTMTCMITYSTLSYAGCTCNELIGQLNIIFSDSYLDISYIIIFMVIFQLKLDSFENYIIFCEQVFIF